MAASDDHSPTQGRGLSLPGQPTEEAIAQVGSEAGLSLVRGLGRLGNAYVSEWTAKREAKAQAIRLAIGTDAKIKTDAALGSARREQEISEFEHREALERRAQRFRVEMAREQINLDAIEKHALEYTEQDPDNVNPREIDEDWLFKFADLAQKVSDRDVQGLWARALSSAAMQGSPKLSAAALQTLSLFDGDIAASFKKFVAVIVRIGFFPYLPEGQAEPQQIDVGTLMELGLVREVVSNEPYVFEDFVFEGGITGNIGLVPLQGHLGLTLRGHEIATAVFRRAEDLPLSEDHEQQYLRYVLQAQSRRQRHLTILPKLNEGAAPVAIRLTNKNNVAENVERIDWRLSEAAQKVSARLKKLLEWAEQTYDIEIK
jgi:Protein of unknown function (DUF2806)